MAATYIDSCMVIGLIEGDTEQRKALKNYLAYQTVFSSELVRLEARILAIRQKKEAQLQLYDVFFAACEFVDLSRAVFDLASVLRAESNLKTPDALHLAAAIQAGCDEFCTNDKQLVKVATQRIKVIDWDMLLQN
ncbi:MAG TPA: PIN domain-containing protein [Methylobacter sp.]